MSRYLAYVLIFLLLNGIGLVMLSNASNKYKTETGPRPVAEQ